MRPAWRDHCLQGSHPAVLLFIFTTYRLRFEENKETREGNSSLKLLTFCHLLGSISKL